MSKSQILTAYRNSRVLSCYFLILLSVFAWKCLAQDSVCVSVKIEIDQQLTLERQGFEARMTLNNGGATDLTNFNVVVNFADENNNTVLQTLDPNDTTARFFIKLTSSATLPNQIAAGAPATLKWLIIPAASAGGAQPNGALYFVGARVTYTTGGVDSSVAVTPAPIRVLPLPLLALDYFLPSDVYGDDPFTVQIEPAIPFSLGVRVRNSGLGVAQKVNIESSQPKIVDNKQGLLVKFQIQGSEVNGATATPSLLANFGDIQPGTSGIARWAMTCSLSGRFTDFSATFTHADALGGRLTSLISQVNTHFLVHDVLVDLPGRDGIRDFLAKDGDTLQVYESQNNDAPVTDVSSGATMGGSGAAYTITVPSVGAGFLYAKLTDPLAGASVITSVTRADGKPINLNNAWLSATQSKTTHLWSYFINIFDTNNSSGASYAVVYGNPAVVNHAPVLRQPADRVVLVGSTVGFIVQATDPDNNPITLTAGALPSGATFVDNGGGLGTFNWTPSASQTGNYPIQFTASDGKLTDRKTVTIAVSANTLLKGWRNRYWPGVTNLSIIGNNANPTGDGLTNLVKYALGLDPTIANDSAGPDITTVQFGGQKYLALTYVGRTDDSNLSMAVVASNISNAPDANWQIVGISMPADQSGVATGFQRFIMRDSIPIDGTLQKRFLRLRVSTTEPE